jgi:hypothetical protein
LELNGVFGDSSVYVVTLKTPMNPVRTIDPAKVDRAAGFLFGGWG